MLKVFEKCSSGFVAVPAFRVRMQYVRQLVAAVTAEAEEEVQHRDIQLIADLVENRDLWESAVLPFANAMDPDPADPDSAKAPVLLAALRAISAKVNVHQSHVTSLAFQRYLDSCLADRRL